MLKYEKNFSKTILRGDSTLLLPNFVVGITRGVANGGAGGADCPPGHQKSGRRAKIGKGKKGERKEKRGKGREKRKGKEEEREREKEREKEKGKKKRKRKGKEKRREERGKGKKRGEEKGEERDFLRKSYH